MRNPKPIALLGALVLLVTSGFHLTGLPMAAKAATEVSSGFFSAALVPLWLMPAIHWSIAALLAIVATMRPSAFSRLYLLVAAFIVFVDAGVMLASIGPFLGELMLGVSGALFLWAGLRTQPAG